MLFAPGDIQKDRWVLCDTCENKANLGILICRLCGCPLASKIAMAGFGCPIGKWPSLANIPIDVQPKIPS
jgi:hypothetical protein